MALISKRHIQYCVFILAALMLFAGGFIQSKSVKYIGEVSDIEVERTITEQEFSKSKSVPLFFDFAIFSSATNFNFTSFSLLFQILFVSTLFSKVAFNFSSRSPPLSIR